MASPVDGDEVPAHHVLEIGVQMRLPKQIEIAIELVLGDEDRAEALNGHIGKRIEPVELNAAALAEHALVVRFERLLRRRQRWSLRIVDEVEHEAALGVAIT